MKSVLISPPQINPIHPHLALPLLCSYLEEKGLDVEIFDLNVLAYDYLLSKDYLKRCKYRVQKIQKRNDFQELALLMSDYLIENIERSKKELRSLRAVKDFIEYRKNVRLIKYALNLVSGAFPGELLSLTQYKSKYGTNTPKKILRNINEENVFSTFNSCILDKVLDKNPDLIGFSIVLVDQLVPALDLAKKIKEKKKSIKIVFGGTTISRLIESIKTDPLYFKYVDFYIQKEGEEALFELINCLNSGGDLYEVPNLIWFNRTIIENKSLAKQVQLNEVPFPNFDGFDLSLYLSPSLVMPLVFSRNCYWNKCTFCDICYGYDSIYRIKGVERLVNEINYLSKRYGVTYFRFVDEAIHPIHLRLFAEELIRKGLNIKWETACRLEKEFMDLSFCNLLFEAGCRALSFGVESGSQEIIDLMNKGYLVDDVDEILKSVYSAGIAIHIYLMVDFPEETEEDFQKTVKLMLRNKKFVCSFQVSKFVLTKKSVLSSKMKGSDLGSSCLNFEVEHTDRADRLKKILCLELPQQEVGQELICTHRMIFCDLGSNDFGDVRK